LTPYPNKQLTQNATGCPTLSCSPEVLGMKGDDMRCILLT